MAGGAGRTNAFESLMDRKMPHAVFDWILASETAPFEGSPDLRPAGIDAEKNPTRILFGWSHREADFTKYYDVEQNPLRGDRPCVQYVIMA